MYSGEIPQQSERMHRLDDCMHRQQKNLTELVDCMKRSAECREIAKDICEGDKELIDLIHYCENELLDAAEHTRRVIDRLGSFLT